MPTENATLVIPRVVMARARAKAALEGTSVSSVVRVWLRAWISGRIPTPEETGAQLPLGPFEGFKELGGFGDDET
jgi:hypothetical protein